jgi:8-oxo-dGTP pyrophosphatase MutT (NUDIX family)/phosphohistidine phosphatase SixA
MAQSAPGPADIVSAGAVVTRKGGEVLLVHRPKYDDWSFPKGKLDPGEHATAAAVREVAEETGLTIRLGPPLGSQRYLVRNGQQRTKHVHYWAGYVRGDDDVSGYLVNAEIDDVRWVALDAAREQLSYDYDRDTLAACERLRRRSQPLLILRHARTLARRSWRDDDRERPLSDAGRLQAVELVPVLAAYGVERLVSSSSRRCWSTVAPYADATGIDLEDTDRLSEENATPEAVSTLVRRLLDGREPSVLCTHRPVLPWVFEALGLDPEPLEKGAIHVVHHRHGEVVATEQHRVGFQ